MANDWRDVVGEVLALQGDPEMKTNPGPALQWYPAQWLGDAAVQLMSMEARGVHHHLLMTAWKGFSVDGDAVPCSIPEDAEVLKAICHHPARWAEVWPQVARAWKALGGRLWNLGLCREYLRQMAKRRSSKGSADARWQRSEPGNDANAPRGHANASPTDAIAPNRECSSVFSLQSSGCKKKNPPSGDPPTGGTTPAKPLNPQAQKVKRLEEFYRARDVKPPEPKILAVWLKFQDGLVERVLAFLADMEARGKLASMEYCGKVVQDWQPRNGGKPVQGKDRGRFAQPHTTAPGSTGKDHGIDF